MFKVVDYLIQSQHANYNGPRLLPLDTRGNLGPAYSLWMTVKAIGRIVAGRLSGRLVGVHVNVAERLSLLRKGLIIVVSRLLGLPVILHLHAAQLHNTYERMTSTKQRLVQFMFKAATCCIVLGQTSRNFVIEKLGVDSQKVEIAINGVPSPLDARRQASPDKPKQVVFLGNLSERKGVSDLLNALSQLQLEGIVWRADFAGGGDIAHYQSLASDLGVGNQVTFHGWVGQHQISGLLARADVMILPSYDEGLPLAILEALSQGVAVVCTPVGEIPTVLQHDVNAKFVQPGDVLGIRDALQHLLTDDRERERLEASGRALYETIFSLPIFSERIFEIHRRYFRLRDPERSMSAAP